MPLHNYASAATSQDPPNDPAMNEALSDYQVLACFGSSYVALPVRAAKARYREKNAEEVGDPIHYGSGTPGNWHSGIQYVSPRGVKGHAAFGVNTKST